MEMISRERGRNNPILLWTNLTLLTIVIGGFWIGIRSKAYYSNQKFDHNRDSYWASNKNETPPAAITAGSHLTRRVNMPNLTETPAFEPAIFWFGKVDPTSNNADVRVWYYDDVIKIVVHIIDRLHWQDPSENITDLTNWDAVSLYFDLDGNVGDVPDINSYRLDAQLGGFKASYRGNGSGWSNTAFPFGISTTWRGDKGPNSGVDGQGWQLTVITPFSSLGLSGPPPRGTVWGLGVAVHDRDDAGGTPIPDQVWPEKMDPNKPATWGQFHFGRAESNRSNDLPQGLTTIQGGFNGAAVPDAHVGGNFICGGGLDHWSEWGEANYAGSTQINVQNQWDISDYPCFSKYFVTFPMDLVPAGKIIVSARLKMTMFGNAGGGQWGEPPDSYIQIFTISEAWDESTLNWNNAPLALENISGTWVKPTQTSDQREYSWDVSKAVMDAYQSGQPVRLALYSADGEMHTGKYFYSSDSNDWGGTVRPRLTVTWGTPCGILGVECHNIFVPAIHK